MADKFIDLKVTGLDGVLETLKQLPAEIVSKRGGPVKLALAKGARMLRDAAKVAMQQQIDRDGSDSTGETVKALIASRGKYRGRGEKYVVRVRSKSYISARKGKTTTQRNANLLEYGSKSQPATPWLRPTAEANAQRIVDAVNADLVRRVDLIVKKLARSNGVPT